MLKLGCMSLSFKDEFRDGKLDLVQFIDRAHDLRLAGIDIHTGAFASTEPAYLRQICMLALQRGSALSYIGVSSNFGKPSTELEGEIATAKQWIDVAAFMGIPLVRVFSAWIPEGEAEEEVWARVQRPMRSQWCESVESVRHVLRQVIENHTGDTSAGRIDADVVHSAMKKQYTVPSINFE